MGTQELEPSSHVNVSRGIVVGKR